MKLYDSYNTEIEAIVKQAKLQAEGVESFIVKDDVGGTMPSLGDQSGYKLFVREDSDKEKSSSGTVDNNLQKWNFGILPGILIGIILGVLGTNLFLERQKERPVKNGIVKSKYDCYVSYKYVNGDHVETIVDRNKDGRDDEWSSYKNGQCTSWEYDNNFDGNIDAWGRCISLDSIEDEVDVDSNGIPDVSATYKFNSAVWVKYHPNKSKVLQMSYNHKGICVFQLYAPDSLGNFTRKRIFDKNGDIVNDIILSTVEKKP